MSNKPKRGRPAKITHEMLMKIVYLKNRYKENGIKYSQIAKILQKDFQLLTIVGWESCKLAYEQYLQGEEQKQQKDQNYDISHNPKSKKIYQDLSKLETIKIELIKKPNLLGLFDEDEIPKNLKWLICGDFQIPFHDRKCVDELVKFVERERPHLVIFNGDITDFYSLSKYTKNPQMKQETQLYDELKLEAQIYERINRASPTTKIVKKVRGGNHEYRLFSRTYTQVPEISDFVYLEKMLHNVCYEENIPINILISENINDYLGKLSIKHVGSLTKYGANKNIENTSYSQAVNHSHRLVIIVTKHKDSGEVIFSLECGCMCKDPQGYRSDVGVHRGFMYGILNTKTFLLQPHMKVLEYLDY